LQSTTDTNRPHCSHCISVDRLVLYAKFHRLAQMRVSMLMMICTDCHDQRGAPKARYASVSLLTERSGSQVAPNRLPLAAAALRGPSC
jgi:hypothetical protein